MTTPTRGRPPAASREMLQDAAFELFLEQGYAGTTVEQIAQRAGVSRNTFFNYFGAKGDVFWVELDEAAAHLRAALARTAPDAAPLTALLDALLEVAADFGPDRVPFALTQAELVGSASDVQASAVGRFTRLAESIREFLLLRGLDDASARAVSFTVVGGIIAAAQAWAAAGASRGALRHFVVVAVGPVIEGFSESVSDVSLSRAGDRIFQH